MSTRDPKECESFVVKRFAAPVIIGLVGVAILISLGNWQVKRLAWKTDILSQIEARISAPPALLPEVGLQDVHQYQPVLLSGTAEGDALQVLISVKQRGAGYRLVTAFETQAGRRILLDRGYVPLQGTYTLTEGPVRLEGNLYWPDDRNDKTPENDLQGNTWFARDLSDMAEVLGTEPLLVVSRHIAPSDKGLTPLAVDTAGIPNDHKHYAITWFSLAGVWLIMTGVWIRRRATGKD